MPFFDVPVKRPIVLQGDLSEEIAATFSGASELGVDCEMMGLNSFRDRLCVVQVGVERGDIVLVQVDEQSGAPRLKALFENPDIVKIFHYARTDIVFLKHRLGIDVTNIYCTKIASRLGRTYTDRHGLKEVARELAGEIMDKSSQSSDWGQSELSEDQVYYAADDVRHLFEIKRQLMKMLEREGRTDLAQRCFDALAIRRDLDIAGFDFDIFAH